MRKLRKKDTIQRARNIGGTRCFGEDCEVDSKVQQQQHHDIVCEVGFSSFSA
jgi:hypothetical protein